MSHYDPGVLTPDSGKILAALLKEAMPILAACRAHAELRDDGLLQGSCMIRGYPFTFIWQSWQLAPWGWRVVTATGNEGLPGAEYKTSSGINGGVALSFMLKRLQQNAAPLPAGGASLAP